ncbi:single-stranded-DNA-specific exonuclease RecJ, partial [Fusobacterium sp.]|uniref:single-stranded-DNA-specific exonuclease RecJ n=1 Tax=Fusobacterium sp. TaxID=68766 RepID=UPI00263634B9
MRNTKWMYKGEVSTEKNNSKYSKDLIKILENRGIKTDEEIEKFLNGDLEDLRDPYDLKDMEKTVEIILDFKEKNKKIWVYGDYDVDGITSTSLLYRAFHEIGIECEYYIPLRDEGYGLNKDAIKKIKEMGGDLIITVDCGISSVEEVRYANEIGIDMIITDHHEINNELPEAKAIINVKRKDNVYDFTGISGVGTAFMLVLALYRKLDIEIKAYKYLDIVAIGTVADLVPLIEDNRIIVKKGLEQLKRTRWNGLNVLLRKLYQDFKEKTYDTYDIGFIIAPIFNAAGRLEDAKKSVELLISEDNKVCDVLSYELIKQNEDRKDIQNEILNLATEEIEEKGLDKKGIIIVAKEKLHSGVIGIVASKIVDRYYKPTIIIDIKPEEGIGVASCRSIEGFNIIESLNYIRDVFTKYGGHSGAAGFSIEIDRIPELKERLEEYTNLKLNEDNFLKPIKIDKEIRVEKISYGFLEEISKIEPFGFGNSTPIFSMKDCKFSNIRKIGKDQTHLMMNIIKNGVEIKNCVWFSGADTFEEISKSSLIDVAFKLKMEVFRDKYQYKIFVEDIKLKTEEEDKEKRKLLEEIDMYDTIFPIKTIFYTRKKVKEKLSLAFYEDKIYVREGKTVVGEIDEATAYLLMNLKNKFNYKFICDVENIEETDENFNIYINIYRDFSFESYKLKEGEIFKEIKEY